MISEPCYFGISKAGALLMGAGNAVVAAGAHQGDIGVGETDVAEQMRVELHQVREDLLAFRAAEQGRQDGHLRLLSCWIWVPVLACGL